MISSIIIVLIFLALLFGFLNGMHDSRNVVSTIISSRAYSPRVALSVTALAEFSGPFIFGVAVAETIGRGIVDTSAVDVYVLIAAMASAILWNLVTWASKIPSSSSHALIGGAFVVPIWVIGLCALALALGTAVGGWRLIHTTGGRFYKIRPVDGFTSQVTSAIVILGASLVGGPVSATQVINSAIMGVGVAERANKIRWGIVQEIVTGWILTIPATGFLAVGIYWLMIWLLR